MATYTPPTENLAIFDPRVFTNDITPITTGEGDKRYLRFPVAQGTENLASINVGGVATFLDNAIFTDNWTLNDTQAVATRTISATCLPAVNPVLVLKADTGGAVFEETDLTQNGVQHTTSSGTTTTRTWVDIIAGGGGGSNLQSVLTAGNTANGAVATIDLTNTGTGGLANPQLKLTNSNATINTIPTIELNKTGRNLTAGESVGSISIYGLDAGSQKTEFARIQTKAENVASGNEDGTLSIFNSVNGVISETFNFNGGQNENNSFRPLDMNGNNIRTSTGDMLITTTGSTGTGTITITPKSGAVVDVGGNATFSGTKQIQFGGGTNITNTINQTGLLINNNTASPDITQSIYQDANCNLVQIQTSTNSQYFNTNTPQNQTIRQMDLTSGTDIQKNTSNLAEQKLDFVDLASSDTSNIGLYNDLSALNNKIEQTYTTGAGAVLTNSLTCSPYGTQRLSMANNNTGFATVLNTVQLQINDTTNTKSITIDNNPNATDNRIDLFKNDGGGISSQLAVVSSTGGQIISLSHTDNATGKSLQIANSRSGDGSINFNNTIDASPFNITTNQNLNLSSTSVGGTAQLTSANGVQITGDNTISLLTNTGTNSIGFTTGNLTFTGAGLQSNTSSGNSGEHLVIYLNGVQYKIALENP